MDNYYTFKSLYGTDNDAAEKFLVDTYGMSLFQAYTFCASAVTIDNEMLAYTFGCMDEARGLTTPANQLP